MTRTRRFFYELALGGAEVCVLLGIYDVALYFRVLFAAYFVASAWILGRTTYWLIRCLTSAKFCKNSIRR